MLWTAPKAIRLQPPGVSFLAAPGAGEEASSWRPHWVVASAVGGIPTQIIHNHTGLLTHSVEGTAYQIGLLSHPQIAARLGERGHEHVKENFLITQNIRRYLTLFLSLGGAV